MYRCRLCKIYALVLGLRGASEHLELGDLWPLGANSVLAFCSTTIPLLLFGLMNAGLLEKFEI
jgi:hypothetical protein